MLVVTLVVVAVTQAVILVVVAVTQAVILVVVRAKAIVFVVYLILVYPSITLVSEAILIRTSIIAEATVNYVLYLQATITLPINSVRLYYPNSNSNSNAQLDKASTRTRTIKIISLTAIVVARVKTAALYL